MDFSQVERLKEEYERGLRDCEEKIIKWAKYKEDYEALQERLTTLPDSLSYDITVPFGDSAFTKGKLVHTNEVMVLLGDDWFAEVSAKQATGIASRRIKHCDKMLEDLGKEKLQMQNWLQHIGEVSKTGSLVDIVEDYEEDKEQCWKEQHKKNVRAYREKLARERKCSEGSNCTSETDEDCIERLSKLELLVGMESCNIECSDDGSHSEEQPHKPSLKLNITARKTSESETGEELENSSPRHDKHVRWMDLSKQNIKKITFKHSKPKKPNTPSLKTKMMHESSEDENHPLIQSPSDIYAKFGISFQSSPPKSILKVKSPSPSSVDMNGPIFPTSEPTMKESSPETDESLNSAFTGEVREHSSPIQIVQSKSTRPVSHFKNCRKSRRK